MAKVTLQKVVKSYDGKQQAVKGIDIDIADKEFVVLVGPSGCGKTTTLRMVAGLESVTGGDILIGDKRVNDLPARDRDIAMVFQNYALYPHLSVYENIAFGLRTRRHSAEDIEARVTEAGRILGIADFLKRKPKELSGGQRQRVAMGRAIVRHPQVFLFDEPLSNLDAKLRAQMRTEIKRIHQTVQATTLYVTHDQIEAMTLADRIVMMNHGVIEQIGTPDEMYHHPASRFVAGFIGSPPMNFFDCHVVQAGSGLALRLADGTELVLPEDRAKRYAQWRDKAMVFGIRPEDLGLATEAARPDQVMPVTIEVAEPLGADTLLYFPLGDTFACARVDPHAPTAVGQTVTLAPNLAHMHLMEPEHGRVV
ncbi:ABC transporter ATP-binding protein [Acidimangrovimonas sediminis]|uniref:ABC transporter ATP-binding protein n=1 Tax=Acidimangrovimonas sediminis TaxID=2056283 RepID=UPI000C7FD97C|nr:sn-glycerol-3-phosphate ABC transporter ATP-binding protein UgpC [Acidimangrovimonas sediminis]